MVDIFSILAIVLEHVLYWCNTLARYKLIVVVLFTGNGT